MSKSKEEVEGWGQWCGGGGLDPECSEGNPAVAWRPVEEIPGPAVQEGHQRSPDRRGAGGVGVRSASPSPPPASTFYRRFNFPSFIGAYLFLSPPRVVVLGFR